MIGQAAVVTATADCPSCGRADHRLVSRTRDYGYLTCSNEFDYVECTACSQIYLRNRPTVSELDRIYPDEYTAYDLDNQLGTIVGRLRDYVQYRKFSVFRHYLKDGDTVMEVGPGSGDLLRVVKKYGSATWRVCGVEVGSKGAEILRRK